MVHVSGKDLREELDRTETDSVRVFDTGAMTVGLKRYSEETAKEKGKRTHSEDELYYILSGAGEIRVGKETHSVATGDLLYIDPGKSHDILDVDEELTVLKIFAR